MDSQRLLDDVMNCLINSGFSDWVWCIHSPWVNKALIVEGVALYRYKLLKSYVYGTIFLFLHND